jgi:hypothetical protein
MRTVIYRIHLFNHVGHKHRPYICMKWKEGKESKMPERQRGRVCAREGGWLREEVASVVKMTVEENGPFRIRTGLKR